MTLKTHRKGLHMKKIACLLSFSLILLGALDGVAAAQQLSGPTGPPDGSAGPLDRVKNPKANEVVDKAKEVVDEASPGAGAPADDVRNEVEDSSEVAEDWGGNAGAVADEPTQAGTTPSDISAPGSTKLTGSTNQTGTGSKDASGAEPSDTEKVAAAGNRIESAPENDEQLAAPEADADESEGSVFSSTGAQILAWLVLACLLMAIGAALVRRSRTGSRA